MLIFIQKKRQKIYCSRSCYDNYRNIGILTFDKCKLCNNPIKNPRARQQFCNIICKNISIAKKGIPREKTLKPVNCKTCNITFQPRRTTRKFCTVECFHKFQRFNYEQCRINGLKGAKISALRSCNRSKNEIYFYKLCCKVFKKVLHNIPMFNGWDADVILPNVKITVQWNGIYHYKIIKKGQELEKVKKRDKLKLIEIVKCGYTPYTIKDMGKHNKKFVESEFEKFKNYVYFT